MTIFYKNFSLQTELYLQLLSSYLVLPRMCLPVLALEMLPLLLFYQLHVWLCLQPIFVPLFSISSLCVCVLFSRILHVVVVLLSLFLLDKVFSSSFLLLISFFHSHPFSFFAPRATLC